LSQLKLIKQCGECGGSGKIMMLQKTEHDTKAMSFNNGDHLWVTETKKMIYQKITCWRCKGSGKKDG
jgi:RecJ-like exonuclease